jgi:hypothetical protein
VIGGDFDACLDQPVPFGIFFNGEDLHIWMLLPKMREDLGRLSGAELEDRSGPADFENLDQEELQRRGGRCAIDEEISRGKAYLSQVMLE